jgi:hypothetical protein
MEEKKENSRMDRARDLIAKLRTSPEGEEFYQFMLDYCKFGRSAFVQGDSDQTMYNLGVQKVGNFLYHAGKKL